MSSTTSASGGPSAAASYPTSPPAYPNVNERQPRWRSTAWGPVFAGAVTAIVVQFVLTVLGIAIGISVAPEAGERAAAGGATASQAAEVAQSIGIGAGVWWLITGTLSLLAGGMVLGRLWMHEDTVVGGPLEAASEHDGARRSGAVAHRADAHRTGAAHNPAASLDMHLHALALWGVVAIFGFLVIWSGAGLATGAASPLATVMGNEGAARAERYLDDGDTARAGAAMEAARDAGQTAAWWSVVGMVVGLLATAGGAAVAAGATHSAPTSTSRSHSRASGSSGSSTSSRREPTGRPATA